MLTNAIKYVFSDDVNNMQSQDLTQAQALPQAQDLTQAQALPQLPSARPRLDPYKILKINKNYDEKTLKKAYLKAAMKSHPDRGGSPQAFQQVSIAFGLLQKRLNEREK